MHNVTCHSAIYLPVSYFETSSTPYCQLHIAHECSCIQGQCRVVQHFLDYSVALLLHYYVYIFRQATRETDSEHRQSQLRIQAISQYNSDLSLAINQPVRGRSKFLYFFASAQFGCSHSRYSTEVASECAICGKVTVFPQLSFFFFQRISLSVAQLSSCLFLRFLGIQNLNKVVHNYIYIAFNDYRTSSVKQFSLRQT